MCLDCLKSKCCLSVKKTEVATVGQSESPGCCTCHLHAWLPAVLLLFCKLGSHCQRTACSSIQVRLDRLARQQQVPVLFQRANSNRFWQFDFVMTLSDMKAPPIYTICRPLFSHAETVSHTCARRESSMRVNVCSQMQSHSRCIRPFQLVRTPCNVKDMRVRRVATRPACQRKQLTATARLVVKESQSGTEYPLAQRFWEGSESRCLGAGMRAKQILVIKAQVYAVALYVEAELAAKELGIRYRGGFFESDDDYCSALVDGAFNKMLVFTMLRDVEGQQFADAVEGKLKPRMQLTGDVVSLEKFVGFFEGVKLGKGTQVMCLWTKAGELQVVVLDSAAAESTDLEKINPTNRLSSEGFARALFELFLGQQSVVADARPVWATGAKELLESDIVKRETRKAGSG